MTNTTPRPAGQDGASVALAGKFLLALCVTDLAFTLPVSAQEVHAPPAGSTIRSWFMDPAGHVRAFAPEDHAIYHWNPESRSWMPPLALADDPVRVAIDPVSGQWWGAYADHTIRSIGPGTPAVFPVSTTSPVADLLIVGGDFAYLTFGAIHILDPSGVETGRSSKNSALNVMAWDPSNGHLVLGSSTGGSRVRIYPIVDGVFPIGTDEKYFLGSIGSLLGPAGPGSMAFASGRVLRTATGGPAYRVTGPLTGTTEAANRVLTLRMNGPRSVVESFHPVNGRPEPETTALDGTPMFIGTGASGTLVATEIDGVIRFATLGPDLEVLHLSEAPALEAGDLTVVEVDSTSASLTWTDSSDNESGFLLEARELGTGTWATIGNAARNQTNGTGTGLTPGRTYQFRVVTLSGTYSTPGDPTAPVSLPVNAGLHGEPYKLETIRATPSSIEIQWADNQGSESGFRITRSAPGSGTPDATFDLPADTTSFTDDSLESDRAYSYRVQARGPTGNGVTSAPVEASTTPATNWATRVTDLSLRTADGGILLKWTDSSPDEIEFVIERAYTGTFLTELVRVPANSTSFLDRTAPRGVAVYYRITSDNGEFRESTEQVGPLFLPSTSGSFTDQQGEFNGIRFFAFAGPNRIERYDTRADQWLPAIPLTDDPQGFWVDADGIFVGQGTHIVRIPREGGEPQLLVELRSGPASSIIATSTWIASNSDDYLAYNKQTGDLAFAFGGQPANFFYFPFRTAIPKPGTDEIVAWIRDDQIVTIDFGDDGMRPSAPGTMNRGGRPEIPRFIPTPDGSQLFTNSGAVFRTSDLERIEEMGFQFTDLTFLTDGTIVVVRDNMLLQLSATLAPLGRLRLPESPFAVTSSGSEVIWFTLDTASPTGIRTESTEVSSFGIPGPLPAPDPAGLSVIPDQIHLAANGTLLMPSASSQCVFRWSTATRDWLPSIALPVEPIGSHLDAEGRTLYLTDVGGHMRRIDLDDPALEAVPLFHDPESNLWVSSEEEVLLVGGEVLFSLNKNGMIVDRTGSTLNGRRYQVTALIPQTRRLLALGPGTSRLTYTRLFADGMLPGGYNDISLTGGGPPILLLRPDQQRLLTTPGTLRSAETLETLFDFEVRMDAAAWIGNTLFSLSTEDGASELRKWEHPSYQLEDPLLRITGTPLAIFPTDVGWILVTDVLGVTRVTLLDDTFLPTHISPAPLLAPSSLAVTGRTFQSVSLEWIDRSDTESGFRIEHRTVGSTNWLPGTTLAAGATSGVVENLSTDTVHEFQVIAFRPDVESAASDIVTARTLSDALEPPGEPYNLTFARVFSTSVTLEWQDNAPNEAGFRVIRTDSEGRERTFTTAPDITTFTNGRLAPGSEWTFRVQIFGPSGPGELSAPVSTRLPTGNFIPPPPGNFKVTSVGPTEVSLQWGSGARNEFGFIIERTPDVSPAVWTEIGRTGFNEQEFTDSTVLPDRLYAYRVVAYNSAGQSTPAVVAVRTEELAVEYLGVSGKGGSRVSFAFQNLIRSYDTSSETWLPDIPLERQVSHLRLYGQSTLIAAEQFVFLHRDGDGPPRELTRTDAPIQDLALVGSRVALVTTTNDTVIQWFDADTGNRLDDLTLGGLDEISSLQPDPVTGDLLVQARGLWFRVMPPGDGTPAEILQRSGPGLSGMSHFFALVRDGSTLLIDSGGAVVDPDTFEYPGSTGNAIEDASVTETGDLVVLRSDSAALLDMRPVEIGRLALPVQAERISSIGNSVLLFRPDSQNPNGVAIERRPLSDFTTPMVQVVPATEAPSAEIGDAFVTTDGRLGVFHWRTGTVSFWSSTERRWTQRWILPETPSSVSWSGQSNSLLYGTEERTARLVDPSDPDLLATTIIHTSYRMGQISNFGPYALAPYWDRLPRGASLLHRLDGSPPTPFPLSHRGNLDWNEDRGRVYLSGPYQQPSYVDLDPLGQVIPPGLTSGDVAFEAVAFGTAKSRLSLSGQRIAFTSGLIADANLALVTNLDREFADLCWSGDELVTLDYSGLNFAQVERLDANWSATQSRRLDGRPLRVLSLSNDQLVVLASWEGKIRVYLLDENLVPIFDSIPQPPALVRPLQDLRVPYSSELTLESDPTGSFPFTFQWFYNGSPMPGENNALLRIPNAGSAAEGQYAVRITNAAGEIQTPPVEVRVGPVRNPRFQPGSLLLLGNEGLKAYDPVGHPLPDPMTNAELQTLLESRAVGDLTVDPLGRLHVITEWTTNGFASGISTWDPDTGRWSRRIHPNVDNTSLTTSSNLGISGDCLITHLTRQHLYSGVVTPHALQKTAGSFQKFSIASDGVLHALSIEGWQRLSPVTDQLLGTTILPSLGAGQDAISAGPGGTAIIGYGNGSIRRFNDAGAVLSESAPGGLNSGGFDLFRDLAFNGQDTIAAPTARPRSYLLSTDLELQQSITSPSDFIAPYADWVQPLRSGNPVHSTTTLPSITLDGPATFQFEASHPDPDEILSWSLGTVTNPGLFRTLTIDPNTGLLRFEPAPWINGSSGLEIILRDQSGRTSARTYPFTIAPLPLPALDLSANLVLNRQTGLYEQTITIDNTGTREIAGFDLHITGLADGAAPSNATHSAAGSWTIENRRQLAAGGSLVLVVEYFNPVRGTPLDPQLSVQLATQPEAHAISAPGGIAVTRCVLLEDALLIEFSSVAGQRYQVQYSDDGGVQWKTSPVPIDAAANRTQWIDRGPPRTDSPPADSKARFYRVLSP